MATPAELKKDRLKKSNDQSGDNEQLFSDEDMDSEPAKKRGAKQRVLRLRDDDDQETTGGPHKKQLSKEYISDTGDQERS
ncbi:hypothetical protein BDN67DRAFT_1011089 [Paxillus ammoniavirescens]|nr:hypothetical protein BDN67DRAFT_1011089 [Paxillus ammoniavirescens]